MRCFGLAAASLMVVVLLMPVGPAGADHGHGHPTLSPNSNLQAIGASDQTPGGSSNSTAPASDDGHTYSLIPSCGLGGQYVCYEPDPCVAERSGYLYDVLRDGEPTGTQVCVTEQEAAEQEQVTPGRVLRAFRRLSWPRSELVIQPPGGTTLVNLPTIFYTDNTAPSRQRVTLLRQGVLIEATPTTYTWHYGDGTSTSTPTAGTPYPAFDITHEYGTVDTFAPRLDTTYTGRYRLEGGPWIAIPETLTVTGASQRLQTVEAIPTLVDY